MLAPATILSKSKASDRRPRYVAGPHPFDPWTVLSRNAATRHGRQTAAQKPLGYPYQGAISDG